MFPLELLPGRGRFRQQWQLGPVGELLQFRPPFLFLHSGSRLCLIITAWGLVCDSQQLQDTLFLLLLLTGLPPTPLPLCLPAT